ncbi:MAG: hypothetical protein KC931_09665, partial [Candidatus Omnitrophica bacterium]|nr:hypothetical protein [Candidatus Omnitrophota bacterium]
TALCVATGLIPSRAESFLAYCAFVGGLHYTNPSPPPNQLGGYAESRPLKQTRSPFESEGTIPLLTPDRFLPIGRNDTYWNMR